MTITHLSRRDPRDCVILSVFPPLLLLLLLPFSVIFSMAGYSDVVMLESVGCRAAFGSLSFILF